MNERLLQFIWQGRYFSPGPFYTTYNEPLEILDTGLLNANQGPDFKTAKIKLGQTLWIGNIEIHVKASDWYKHHHQSDPNFQSVILHVVWEEDSTILDLNGNRIPCFCLEPWVPKMMLNRFRQLMEDQLYLIPCNAYLKDINTLHWTFLKERLLVERLQFKTAKVLSYYQQSKHDWETVCWWMIAHNFGLTVNALLFEAIAKNLSLNMLKRHSNQLLHLEALLMGQANLLEADFEEAYPIMLKKEYKFLQKKYGLPKINIQPAFLRMRPAAFPSLRLSQLAMLLQQSSNFFSCFKEATSIQEMKNIFHVKANDYWLYHYRFDHPTVYSEKLLGQQMVNNILINTVIPLLFAYGHLINDPFMKEKALSWIEQLPPERNHLIQQWSKYGISCRNAGESQALIELTQYYCIKKNCLDCTIGSKILRKGIEAKSSVESGTSIAITAL